MAEQLAQLIEPGLWVERIGSRSFPAGTPALFLDRDGTLNVDTGYPRDPAAIFLLEGALEAIRAANAAPIPVVIVTNQSGVARGLLSWADFAAVTARVLELLSEAGCTADLVLACGYHQAGQGVLGVADHPMRKPQPGMLQLAADLLAIDLSRSAIIGDGIGDMQAGAAAGLERGFFAGEGAIPALDGFAVEPLGPGALAWVRDRCRPPSA